MKQDYLNLAIGNLKHRGIRSWLTMLGIFIGIAAVVSLILMGQGLREAITGQFSSLSADKLVIQNAETGFGPPGSTSVKKLNDQDIQLLEKVNGINNIIPRLLRVVRTEYNKGLAFNYVVSLPEDQKKIDLVYESFGIKEDEGRLLDVNNRGKIIIGKDISKESLFGKEIKVGNSITIQGKDFEVVGILKKASSFQINLAIFMLEDDLKNLLNIKDEYDFIAVQVEDKNQIETVSEEIANTFRKDRKEKLGEESFTIQTPVQALGTINTILTIINLIVGGIAAISLLVGGLGIANTMYTSVLERTKEIGTMKAIGAKNSDILKIFLIESGLLGLVGGVVGALIGLTLAFIASTGVNSYFGEDIFVPQFNLPLLLGAITFSLVIGVASGILPAIQASKLKPVEALRK